MNPRSLNGMAIVEVRNAVKNYRRTRALNDVSLEIEKGSIYCLLGPNGAGKTTLMKSILNLTSLDSGQIRINGIDSARKESRRSAVFLPELFTFYPYYTVEETVEFFASMHGLSRQTIHEKLPLALEKFQLLDLAQRKTSSLSKGQLQRTALAHVVISDLPVLILDEPFSGLDPMGMRALETILLQLKDEGKTIILSSHILRELETFADRFVILNRGNCLAVGSLREIKKKESLEDFFFHLIESSAHEPPATAGEPSDSGNHQTPPSPARAKTKKKAPAKTATTVTTKKAAKKTPAKSESKDVKKAPAKAKPGAKTSAKPAAKKSAKGPTRSSKAGSKDKP